VTSLFPPLLFLPGSTGSAKTCFFPLRFLLTFPPPCSNLRREAPYRFSLQDFPPCSDKDFAVQTDVSLRHGVLCFSRSTVLSTGETLRGSPTVYLRPFVSSDFPRWNQRFFSLFPSMLFLPVFLPLPVGDGSTPRQHSLLFLFFFLLPHTGAPAPSTRSIAFSHPLLLVPGGSNPERSWLLKRVTTDPPPPSLLPSLRLSSTFPVPGGGLLSCIPIVSCVSTPLFMPVLVFPFLRAMAQGQPSARLHFSPYTFFD